MFCSYCDESIHPSARFCPKCGLPVRGDSTATHGAYLSDDSGPNLWVIGGIVASLVGVIVIASSLGNQKATPVRQAAQMPTHGAAPLIAGNSAWGQTAWTGLQTQPQASPYVWNPTVRWGWTPPATPPQRRVVFEPAPPPVMLASASIPRYSRPAVVYRPVSYRVPPVPQLPAWMPQRDPDTGGLRWPDGTITGSPLYRQSPTYVAPGSTFQPDAVNNGNWVWDPVQGRWARQGGRL